MKDEYKIHDENLINELLDANAKMRELLEKSEAERDKRDIKQRIEELEDFEAEFDAQNDYYGNTPMAYVGDLKARIKQLRKELEK